MKLQLKKACFFQSDFIIKFPKDGYKCLLCSFLQKISKTVTCIYLRKFCYVIFFKKSKKSYLEGSIA